MNQEQLRKHTIQCFTCAAYGTCVSIGCAEGCESLSGPHNDKPYFLFIKASEAVSRRYSIKKVFLEILQNSQEKTCARVSFLLKLEPETCNFIKKRESRTGVFL